MFRSFPAPLLHGMCALCHQLLLVRKVGVSPLRLFQQLAISPTLLHPLWASIESIRMEGFRYVGENIIISTCLHTSRILWMYMYSRCVYIMDMYMCNVNL